LELGDWAHSPIHNPQSPIPNPQLYSIYLNKIIIKYEIKIILNILIKTNLLKRKLMN